MLRVSCTGFPVGRRGIGYRMLIFGGRRLAGLVRLGGGACRSYFNTHERRGSVVVSMSACHAGNRGSLPGAGTLLGVKTWLSTVEIVYLCVFRMRH